MDMRLTPAGLPAAPAGESLPTFGRETSLLDPRGMVRRVCDNFLYEDQGRGVHRSCLPQGHVCSLTTLPNCESNVSRCRSLSSGCPLSAQTRAFRVNPLSSTNSIARCCKCPLFALRFMAPRSSICACRSLSRANLVFSNCGNA